MSAVSPLAQPEAWNLVAPEYVRELVAPFETFSRDALLRAGVASGTRVVDVAAGPGTLALLAAREGARVTAVDFSAEMIAALRARATEARLDIDALEGDGMALPFEDGAFDAAFSMFGLIFFPDRARGFQELHRVLRPGGRAVVSSWTPFDRSREMRAVYTRLWEKLGVTPAQLNAGPMSDPDTCQQEMASAGFVKVTVHEVQAHLDYPSTAVMVDATTRSSAPAVLARRALGAQWEPLFWSMHEHAQAELGAGPQRVTLTAYLTTGARP
ncbi:class I SAM-dependent methyltransferase [Corallococcus macrosporus]|uniref:UbiE/COQ5 family methyltransferase n=1 Tax=Myxococcus fulvus (strain ATCC BAA-855 / HW-1) TaxID=483219 RepID=F8CLF4_MYXFH|nr:class I SAM-dependent methyltransferase [Corallococcus macrosporus]AEI66478.1 UbiE/COQ5 family methyltransferase [Corallococcus macrosporus]